MNILLTGVTATGNMGGVAMLNTTVDRIKVLFPDASIGLLSISPAKDQAEKNNNDYEIIPCPYIRLILFYAPIMCFFAILRKPKWFRGLLTKCEYFRNILSADMIIDLSGIAFVDNRGLALLAYNTSICLAPIILDKPIYKLSQSLGPFNKWPNYLLAKFTLSRCRKVVARGEKTLEFLKTLNLENTVYHPDVTFAMNITQEKIENSKKIISQHGLHGKIITISPSEVVNRLCKKKNIDLLFEMSSLIKLIVNTGYQVLILPHSLANNSSKNNDIKLSLSLFRHFNTNPNVKLIYNFKDPALLRAIIGQSYIFIGCRFHSVVAALSMGIPSIIIGWSHKYKEMGKPFQVDQWALDYNSFNAKIGFEMFLALIDQYHDVKENITAAEEDVRRLACQNFNMIKEDLELRYET